MKILALVSDIIFIPIIQSALSKHDVKFVEVYNGEEADLFVLDMDHNQSFELCKKFPEKSFCFGSHKNTELMEKFRQTECKNVFARSAIKTVLQRLNS